MAAAFYFCTQKQGFHEDEYYTYYSTARTNGFYVEDGQWMKRDVYRNEFVVLPGQRFQYGLVKLVQSWDVHPPMYYWVFHTVASFVPNVFSKWIGLSVNLFFHGIGIALLTYLSYLVSGKDVRMSLLVIAVYGLSPAALSGVVFIRMYEMLTVFVLLCAILHMRVVERNEEKLSVAGSLVPMAVVTYVGFLTQYYYFIFLFFLAIAFCMWLLWRDRKLWNCVRYGVSQGTAFVLAYLTYPAFPGQMFHGQRGAQATENFFNLSNTFGRLWFFLDLMNGYVFGYLFFMILGIIVLLAVVQHRWGSRKVKSGMRQEADDGRKRPQWVEDVNAGQCAEKGSGRTNGMDSGRDDARFGIEYVLLLVAAIGYFLAVSKTALLLGETSNRYQLPIYGIVVLLTFLGVRTLWRKTIKAAAAKRRKSEEYAVRYRKYMEKAAVVFCFAVIVMGHLWEDVVFLYPEDKMQTAYAKERAAENTPVVYLYQSGEEWCIWDVTNELLEYPEVYFAAADRADTIEDEKIRNADSLVVYVNKGGDAARELTRVCGDNPALADRWYQLVFEEKYCDVYYIAAGQ